MNRELRVLAVEDSEDDFRLLARELRRAGYPCRPERVELPSQFEAALGSGDWDLILSDYRLPAFSAPEALRRLKASGRDIPFILVSGAIGEEAAAECMRAGASDYLAKGSLLRLGPVVRRELADCAARREARSAAEKERHREAEYRLLFEEHPSPCGSSSPAPGASSR